MRQVSHFMAPCYPCRGGPLGGGKLPNLLFFKLKIVRLGINFGGGGQKISMGAPRGKVTPLCIIAFIMSRVCFLFFFYMVHLINRYRNCTSYLTNVLCKIACIFCCCFHILSLGYCYFSLILTALPTFSNTSDNLQVLYHLEDIIDHLLSVADGNAILID